MLHIYHIEMHILRSKISKLVSKHMCVFSFSVLNADFLILLDILYACENSHLLIILTKLLMYSQDTKLRGSFFQKVYTYAFKIADKHIINDICFFYVIVNLFIILYNFFCLLSKDQFTY